MVYTTFFWWGFSHPPIQRRVAEDSVLLIRIATNREKEEHEPNGEDRRRANPTRQVPRPFFWGGWGVFCFFVQKWWYD